MRRTPGIHTETQLVKFSFVFFSSKTALINSRGNANSKEQVELLVLFLCRLAIFKNPFQEYYEFLQTPVEFLLMPSESSLGLRNLSGDGMFDTKAWRNIFWAGFTFDLPKIYFYLYPSSLFSVFLLPGTIPDNSLSKNAVSQFTTMCPPSTGLVRTDGVRHK